MKKILFTLCALIALASCHDGEDPDYYKKKEKNEGTEIFNRTVLIYISGENDLNRFLSEELQQMRRGSVGIGNNALVVYVDDATNRNPCIMRIQEGNYIDSLVFQSDSLSSHPDVMARVLSYTSSKYAAREYGLVLWGHASGWLQEDSVDVTMTAEARNSKRGYGLDYGATGTNKWMNTPTLGLVLHNWGQHLKFIFADCCQFQCIENAYELRTTTDYLIASPAEIPGMGAPYHTIVKGLFDASDTFYQTIADCYFEQVIPLNYLNFNYNTRTPISVVKTDRLPLLAQATNEVLSTFLPLSDSGMPDLRSDSLIYYRGNIVNTSNNIMYDMNDFILHYADKEAYASWKQVFDQTVIYKTNARDGWMTNKEILAYVFGRDHSGNLSTTVLTDERYGGISMFVPQERGADSVYARNNDYIRNMSWYYAAQLNMFGW